MLAWSFPSLYCAGSWKSQKSVAVRGLQLMYGCKVLENPATGYMGYQGWRRLQYYISWNAWHSSSCYCALGACPWRVSSCTPLSVSLSLSLSVCLRYQMRLTCCSGALVRKVNALLSRSFVALDPQKVSPYPSNPVLRTIRMVPGENSARATLCEL